MPQKKSFIDIDDSILNHFSLELGDRKGLLVNNELCSVYVGEDATQWKKIRKLLSSSTYDIDRHTGKKRAYILNNCDVTNERIRAACKEHSITITNDIDKADILITHDNIGKKHEHGDHIRSGEVMFRFWNYNLTGSSSSGIGFAVDVNYLGDQDIQTIICNQLAEKISVSYDDTLLEGWGISGMGLKMAHLIDTKELETLNVEHVLGASATKVVLDKSLLETLKSMLTGYDDDNKEMAKKILPTIDKTKNIHYLWELFQECNYEIDRLGRDKDVKYWLKSGDMNEYYHMTAEDMILDLSVDDKKMSKETFMYFEQICRAEIQITNRELYVFKVKLKKEYRHYYEQDKV